MLKSISVPGSRSAPDIQLRPDLRGALTHSRQTVVAHTTIFKLGGRNALSIIANPQPEQIRFAGSSASPFRAARPSNKSEQHEILIAYVGPGTSSVVP
jgi:hypothetical protein